MDVRIEGNRIVSVTPHAAHPVGVRVIDATGLTVMPGLIELHTDHLEAHYVPRPKVFWDATAAVVSYDSQLATSGITSNCISPGYVWTPLVEKQIPDTMKARNLTKEQVIHDVLLTAQPTKQFVTVDQVAAFAVFLCSDAASQMTGANYSMDGGWTAQ